MYKGRHDDHHHCRVASFSSVSVQPQELNLKFAATNNIQVLGKKLDRIKGINIRR